VADSSVIAWRRKTTETVEIGGLPVPVGANLLLGSGNRNPAVFETPERFDIHRLKPEGRYQQPRGDPAGHDHQLCSAVSNIHWGAGTAPFSMDSPAGIKYKI
jgi:cytochrome P450